MASVGRRTRRTVLSFTIILVVFLFVADGLVIMQQANLLRTEMTAHVEQEFDLFEKLISGSLIKGDYASVEEAVTHWGESQKEVLELNIITANGFTIATYKQDVLVPSSKRFQGKLEYGFANMATITMVKDISALSAETTRLAYQLVVFSILLVAILGLLLQRTAVRPLQQEIIERQKTEEKLQHQTDELLTINKEVETLSYSLSHDLRSPLRSIAGFSQILQEDAGHKLTAGEADDLKRIISASNRMAELIDDMLRLGRVTRSELETDEVNFAALAENTVEQLGYAGDIREIKWTIESGLSAVGDKKLLALLVDNLLGNAWKYTSKTAKANIEFGMTQRDGENVYFVKDNGVGFDMQYAEKIFGAFQRLHREEDYPGTGIGLATVQRIVHRHGGRIWAEAAEGQGATFFFTLPGV